MSLNSLSGVNLLPAFGTVIFAANTAVLSTQVISALPALGANYIAWLEFGAGADIQTWYGSSGLGLQATLLM
jgi:hypothetical protein